MMKTKLFINSPPPGGPLQNKLYYYSNNICELPIIFCFFLHRLAQRMSFKSSIFLEITFIQQVRGYTNEKNYIT